MSQVGAFFCPAAKPSGAYAKQRKPMTSNPTGFTANQSSRGYTKQHNHAPGSLLGSGCCDPSRQVRPWGLPMQSKPAQCGPTAAPGWTATRGGCSECTSQSDITNVFSHLCTAPANTEMENNGFKVRTLRLHLSTFGSF